ncbi:OsmC family protein [Entomobacter blattae]|uniref:Peroxiredoxin OsmC n=1 Tax=Entomobacter blattae TaxID=2762277 RepID=A0A7H1NQJ2_9PROT|nr:OsmC family protein [Entomobacter blattae]QNT78052.1 Peroxiredoxin OsmC [Entomobacter blattae]
MKKTASAQWHGNLKDGKGTISTQSGALSNAPYGFKARFEEGPGTNPEELIGAAHAGCFTMAFSLFLQEAGYTADTLDTKAEVTLEKDSNGFTITAIHLTLIGKVPGLQEAEFKKLAETAKENCPVSKLFNAKITLSATLQG